jgi:hypothetical protein
LRTSQGGCLEEIGSITFEYFERRRYRISEYRHSFAIYLKPHSIPIGRPIAHHDYFVEQKALAGLLQGLHGGLIDVVCTP